MAFLKTDGKWMEAKEYYSNDFAGELHNDAQIVNVKLDGMIMYGVQVQVIPVSRQAVIISVTAIRRHGL